MIRRSQEACNGIEKYVSFKRMNPSWGPVIAATVVAWAGAIAALLLRRAGGRVMQPLVYCALLFFGASAIFDILPESKAALRWPVFAPAAAGGYLFFWVVGKYVAPICPACAMHTLERDHAHAHGRGLMVLAAVLAVHCALDGVGLSAASTVDASFGMRVFAAVALHKLPEGFALATMLAVSAGSASRAFAWSVVIEAATLGGAAAAGLWAAPSPFWLAIVLAHIGGTFLYLSITGLRDALTPPPLVVARL